jgi:hypothetical protein
MSISGRCDLAMAINYGIEPVFFGDPSLEPLIPYDLAPPISETSSGIGASPQPVGSSICCTDLQQAWTAMIRFCSAINYAVKRGRRLPKEVLLSNMGSVMYRVVRIKHELNPVDGIIRLGLLAFSSHVLLRVRNVPSPHTYLPNLYRDRLLDLPPEQIPLLSLVWLLMVGHISLFTPADDHWLLSWLRGCLTRLEVNNWDELRDKLKGLLWIDALHDTPGKAIFDTVYRVSGPGVFNSRLRNG